jgi:hypothetical protein
LYGAVAFNNVEEFASNVDSFLFVREDAFVAENTQEFPLERPVKALKMMLFPLYEVFLEGFKEVSALKRSASNLSKRVARVRAELRCCGILYVDIANPLL